MSKFPLVYLVLVIFVDIVRAVAISGGPMDLVPSYLLSLLPWHLEMLPRRGCLQGQRLPWFKASFPKHLQLQ